MSRILSLLPGLALCAALALVAHALQWAEEALLGRAYLEALVLALLLGTLLRLIWTPPQPRFGPGIAFSGKFLLELAVVLLGASLQLHQVLAAGPLLPLGIAGMVMVALGLGALLGRLLGLPLRMSILIATGNAICGNSAIAAVAPTIGARSQDVAAAIAFTAVLGVAVVLLLPLAVPLLQLDPAHYGMLAGATVYAVPQVLAATLPVGDTATDAGTVVKLMRVLMLGPVLLILALGARRFAASGTTKVGPLQLVPWFILGFATMAGLRAAGAIPPELLEPMRSLANGVLTVLAMAALGLGTDLRALVKVGPRVAVAVTGSLAVLVLLALALVRWVPPPA